VSIERQPSLPGRISATLTGVTTMHPSLKLLGFTTLFVALAGCGKHDDETTAAQAPAPEAAMPAPAPMETPPTAPVAASVPAPKLQAAMRGLWHDHIVHSREYAMAVHAHNAADAKKAADAVVENAKQISGAVAGFYGKPGGDRLMELLAGHWGAIKAMTDARAKNDTLGADKAMKDASTNVDAIAKFLAGANPNLPEDTVRGLYLAHVAHHSQQIQQIMAGDTAGEATSWADMQTHMDSIADALTGAIAKQFPDKAS
jgi:hypothetical protein